MQTMSAVGVVHLQVLTTPHNHNKHNNNVQNIIMSKAMLQCLLSRLPVFT